MDGLSLAKLLDNSRRTQNAEFYAEVVRDKLTRLEAMESRLTERMQHAKEHIDTEEAIYVILSEVYNGGR